MLSHLQSHITIIEFHRLNDFVQILTSSGKLCHTGNLGGGFGDVGRNKKTVHFSTRARCLQSVLKGQCWADYHFQWKFCAALFFEILTQRKQGHFAHFDIVNWETFKQTPETRRSQCHAGAIWEDCGHPQRTSRGIIHNSFPAVTEMVNTKGQWRSMQEKH